MIDARRGIALVMALSCAMACARAADVRTSTATRPEQVDLVDVATRVPDAKFDMRYAGDHNFVGTRIDGYLAPKCYLLRPVADALQRVADDLRADGYRLHVYDCYRPTRAVKHFVRWAHDLDDQRTRAEFYPTLGKQDLLGGYIAETSGHSRGATIDLGLDRCVDGACEPLDFGTPFDFFDTLANTDDPRVTAVQRQNRDHLRAAMERHGFRNYSLEWWHFTLNPEPTPNTAYDVPVQ